MPGIGISSLILVCFSVQCVAYSVPQDPCKNGDDGITLKDCRRTTEVEKCPNQTEWYDERFDRVTVCCCSCHPGYLTHKDSGSLTCHPTKPSEKPDFPTTDAPAHPTSEKAYTEPRFNDTSTVPLTVTSVPATTSPPPTPPETATISGPSTSDANVTSPGQEAEKVNSDSLIVGIVFGVIGGVIVIVLVFLVLKKLCKSVYSSCKNLNENGRRGQSLQNGVETVEMQVLGNRAEDQNEAHNDDGANGDIVNQDAEAQRDLLGEDDVPQLED